MPPGKVLIVVENNSVPMDRRVWYEATALRDAGWQVSVICPDGNNNQSINHTHSQEILPDQLDDIYIYRFPLSYAEKGMVEFLQEYLQAFISISCLSWKIWRKDHFNVIHICNPPDIFFIIGLIYRVMGSKFIFDHHDLFPELIQGRYSGFLGKVLFWIARLTEYCTYKFANMVIVTNESYRQVTTERNKIKDDKVIIVRNGPKISQFKKQDPATDLKAGFKFMVCFVGIMGEDDGVLEFVEIIRHIVVDLERTDILFALIGDGSARQAAWENISSFGGLPFVSMPGFIHDDHQLLQYMSTADLFVSPEPPTPMNQLSTFIKIGEYMSMGKPIVAFELKETRRTAEGAARYIHPGDIEAFGRCIVDLLNSPDECREMGKIGQERVKYILGWEHQQKKLLSVYQNIQTK
jgi:glycosyltransferase involved in cell wall biosynthesis